MAVTEKTIEAEVLEIDGVTVRARVVDEAAWKNWRGWQANIKQLNVRWWPLWLVLCAVLLIIAIGLGICVILLLMVWSLVKALLAGLARLFSKSL